MCDKKKSKKSRDPLLRSINNFQDYILEKDHFSDDPDPYYYIVDIVNDIDRIIAAVVNDKLEQLTELLTTPEQIVDASGVPLLHMAVYQDSWGPFEYLLELGYDIEETDEDGQTPLAVALSGEQGENRDMTLADADYFAVHLLNWGANLDNLHFKRNPSYTHLHFALEKNHVKTAKILIARKVDLEARTDSGMTPIHSCLSSYEMSTVNKWELISMMIFHGAQITSEHVNFSLEKGELEIYEFMSDYVPASDLRDVAISVGSLIKAMKTEPKLFRKFCGKIAEIKLSSCCDWRDLLKSKADNFSWLMQNFEYETDWILQRAYNFDYFEIDEDSMEVLDVIFGSQLRFLLLKKFQFHSVLEIVDSHNSSEWSFEKMRECLMFFLSHGLNLYDEDLQFVFEQYGYTKFFKELLQFGVEECKEPIGPHRHMDNLQVTCICEIHNELPEIMENLREFSVHSCWDFLGYSARPQLVDYCRSLLNKDENVTDSKIATLPNVPKLQEFARDESRVFLVQSLGLKSTEMFYGALQRLPIPEIIKKIVSFEVPLY